MQTNFNKESDELIELNRRYTFNGMYKMPGELTRVIFECREKWAKIYSQNNPASNEQKS